MYYNIQCLQCFVFYVYMSLNCINKSSIPIKYYVPTYLHRSKNNTTTPSKVYTIFTIFYAIDIIIIKLYFLLNPVMTRCTYHDRLKSSSRAISPNALLTWCLDKPVKLHLRRRVATSAKICNHVFDHGPITTTLASGLARRSNDLAYYHFITL